MTYPAPLAPAPKLRLQDGQLKPDLAPGQDEEAWLEALSQKTGQDREYLLALLGQAVGAVAKTAGGEADTNAVLAAICEVGTQDVIELMLVLELAASHRHCLDMFKKCLHALSEETHQRYIRLAAQLMSSNAKLVQAIDRHRRGNAQTVTVKHVHVHDGGQAVVGVVGGR